MNEKILNKEIEEIELKREKEFTANSSLELPMLAEDIKKRSHRIVNDLYHIGKNLTHVKRILRHGDFQNWVNENCHFGKSTAHNLMKLYCCCAGNPDLPHKINPCILYEIGKSKFPEKLKEYILENADCFRKTQLNKFKTVAEKFAKGDMDIDAPEVQELFEYSLKNTDYHGYKQHIENCISSLETIKNLIKTKLKQVDWPKYNGTDKIFLNQKQSQKLKDLQVEIQSLLSNLYPDLCGISAITPKYIDTIQE